MSVILSKSVCADCIWKKSCQRLERINGSDNRGDGHKDDNDDKDSHGHRGDIFDVVIIRCSIKNCDRSYKMGDSIEYDKRRGERNSGKNDEGGDNTDRKQGMHYCVECSGMHHEWSSIGRLHKKVEQ